MTREDVITASGKYKNRANSKELTQEVLNNIDRLITAVSALFYDLKSTIPPVSSGFRPSTVNASIPTAAKKSLHMRGLAVDLEDKDGTIGLLIKSRPDFLSKHSLWLEDLNSTKGWVHLDLGSRLDRPSRTFLP